MGVPSIHFGLGAEHLAEAMRDAGGDVIGIDCAAAHRRRVGPPRRGSRACRATSTPTLLTGPLERVLEAAAEILAQRAATGRATSSASGTGCCPPHPHRALHTLVRYVHTFHS